IFDFFAEGVIDAANHTEVDEADYIAGNDHYVAGMRIGVIHAMSEDHCEVEIGAAAGNFLEIEAEVLQFFGMRELDALEVLHGQHAGRGELRIGARDFDRRIVSKEVGELSDVAELAGEIELATKNALEFCHGGAGAVISQFGDTLGPVGKAGEDI